MEDEVEDIVGEVKYTDSQKSVTTSAVYSLDFTDSSSDKNNSSGKETYVIEYDSDDSDKTFQVHKSESNINLTYKESTINVSSKKSVTDPVYSIDRSVCTGLSICNIIAQEIFTQTSKTIIELAQKEGNHPKENTTLETQTSFVSITENKSIAYKIQILGTNCKYNSEELKQKAWLGKDKMLKQNIQNMKSYNNMFLTNTFNDKSTTLRLLEKENNAEIKRIENSDEDVIHFIEDEPKEDVDTKITSTVRDSNSSELESSNYDSDMENDSLMENEYCDSKTKSRDNSETSEMINSVDSDVEELYSKLSQSPQLLSPILSVDPPTRTFGLLSPLTEETVQKKDSIVDVTPSSQTLTKIKEHHDKNNLSLSSTGVKVTLYPEHEGTEGENHFKLPPICKNQSFPYSPHLNFLFTLNNQEDIDKTAMLPSLYKKQNEGFDRWEIGTKDLASGENPHINDNNDPTKNSKDTIHLPSIHLEGFNNNTDNKKNSFISDVKQTPNDASFDIISIQGKIKELKMTAKKTRGKFSSRSVSPTSLSSPNETRICDTAERACDLLCAEQMRRLRSSSWVEVTETLEDLPSALEKFWFVITENRIADLIRQVSGHIESPRTQVARAACKSLAEILKKTNYTKKPDFYEAMSMLLTKTGSYNRPVRREANVALDEIVCSIDVTHCVTAICVYGVSHKSVLVRCSSARLLVVCCALAEGGRQILRTRPPSAAAARKYALRSLAELLQDKNTDTRKYAERLYAILRPLPNFEAYFLTDVDVELATKHMKKYDQLLNNTKTR